VKNTKWDKKQRGYKGITGVTCGENRYIGVKNILEFYITPGCVIDIKPQRRIACSVRMKWTMTEFFASGGTTKFVDRLASSLGIFASQIKIVSLFEGSLVIDYDILSKSDDTNDEDETESLAELQEVQKKQTEMMATGKLDLGAPILDSNVEGGSVISNGVVTAPDYEPIIITETPTNIGAAGNSGSNTNSNSGSTSSSSSNSFTKTPSNVKTGTKKEYEEYNPNKGKDFFENIKLANGEGKTITKEEREIIQKILDENKVDQQESSTKTIGAQNQEMADRNIK